MNSLEAAVNLPEGVRRVAAALQQAVHAHLPVMLDDAARTAQQAADALGIAVGQIAKSIIFRRKSDDAAVLVITSGEMLQQLWTLIPQWYRERWLLSCRIFVVSERLAEQARELGWQDIQVADSADNDALLRALQ